MMAKLLSQTSVNMEPLVVETKFTPKLLIPSEEPYLDGAHYHFPCFGSIKLRRNTQNVRLVEEFKKAISTAQRVWIIDKHLFSEDGKNPIHTQRIKKVVGWFYTDQIQTIRILTGHHDDQAEIEKEFKVLEEIVTGARARVDTPLKVELSFCLKNFDYIHDRFAIIDDELWHFGATVGGFHRDVNAASRGWRADTHKAVQFFDTAWNIANINGKK